MTCYFFDLSDDGGVAPDDEGMLLADLQEVEKEAAKALSEAAQDALVRPNRPAYIAVEVRDELGAVMRMRFKIEVEVLRRN